MRGVLRTYLQTAEHGPHMDADAAFAQTAIPYLGQSADALLHYANARLLLGFRLIDLDRGIRVLLDAGRP